MSQIIITLGNTAPHQADKFKIESLAVSSPDPRNMVPLDPMFSNQTVIIIDETTDIDKAITNIVGLWPHHSARPPSWIQIASDRPIDALNALELQLRQLLGMPPALTDTSMLLTNAGLDFVAKQMGGAASATAVAKWIALTANNVAPAAGDTALTGEIATAGGGLVRAAGTYAHTAAATTYTISNTFTANANDVLPVTIAKAGTFDAAAAGNMPFETLLSATATLSAVGDNIPLTWTVTI